MATHRHNKAILSKATVLLLHQHRRTMAHHPLRTVHILLKAMERHLNPTEPLLLISNPTARRLTHRAHILPKVMLHLHHKLLMARHQRRAMAHRLSNTVMAIPRLSRASVHHLLMRTVLQHPFPRLLHQDTALLKSLLGMHPHALMPSARP